VALTGQNVTMYEGDEPTLRFALRAHDADDVDTGPLNLTGATLSWRMQGLAARAPVVTDAPGGVVEVAMVSADTAGRGGEAGDARQWRHELRVVDAFGSDQVVSVGTITVRGALHDEP
jgi:hypothetical protein